MSLMDSFLTAWKMLFILLTGGVYGIFVLIALLATLLLFSILPRRACHPSGRILAAGIIFWNTKTALSCIYIPTLYFLMPVIALAFLILCFVWQVKTTGSKPLPVFDLKMGWMILLWGTLWILGHLASILVQGSYSIIYYFVIPMGLLGCWITGRAFALLWRELSLPLPTIGGEQS